MNKQTRNKAYPQEFREQVVNLVQAGGQTVSEIAREFEISDGLGAALAQAGRTGRGVCRRSCEWTGPACRGGG